MKNKEPKTPRRDRRKERIDSLEAAVKRCNERETSEQQKASRAIASAESTCAILMAERADLLARVQRVDVLLLTLGVRRGNTGSPNVDYYPSATGLRGGF